MKHFQGSFEQTSAGGRDCSEVVKKLLDVCQCPVRLASLPRTFFGGTLDVGSRVDGAPSDEIDRFQQGGRAISML